MENKTLTQTLIESFDTLFSNKKNWQRFIKKTSENTAAILKESDEDNIEGFQILTDGTYPGGSRRTPIYNSALGTWNWPKKHYRADERLNYIVPMPKTPSRGLSIESVPVFPKNTNKQYSRIESMISLTKRGERLRKERDIMFSNNTIARLRTLTAFLKEDLPRLPNGYEENIIGQLYDMVNIIAERNKNNMLGIRNPEWKRDLQAQNNENIAKLPLEAEIENFKAIVSIFQEKVDQLGSGIMRVEEGIIEAEYQIKKAGGNERFEKSYKKIENIILSFPQKIIELKDTIVRLSALGILNGIITNIDDIEQKIYSFEDSFVLLYQQLRAVLNNPKELFSDSK